MTRGAIAAGVVLALASGCECRPLLASHWRDLGIRCDEDSPFGADRADRVVLEDRAALVDFLRRDCNRASVSPPVPEVDFDRNVVIVEATTSPLSPGDCVAGREVAEVHACLDGVALLYDDQRDPDCTPRRITGSASVRREDVRGPFSAR
ncbi:MAG: hypothetical protein HY904_19395 [Deltaproteobacteria bacterium]|nr:hypothetical protein [Deltaproteobacteria bacterium]